MASLQDENDSNRKNASGAEPKMANSLGVSHESCCFVFPVNAERFKLVKCLVDVILEYTEHQ
jgi:hypothetical protein